MLFKKAARFLFFGLFLFYKPLKFEQSLKGGRMKKSILILILSISFLNAQGFNVGADLVSRYIWRGLEAAPGVSIQPNLSYSGNGLSVGVWASYALSPQAANADENDFWLSYSRGAFSLTVTDYYYPSGVNPDISDFSDNGFGAHVDEVALSYSGGKDMPLDVMLAVNVYNDPDHSFYLELTWHGPGGVDVFTGITKGKSAWYAVYDKGAKILNAGLNYSKEIKITSDFSLPISGRFIVNPVSKRSFLVFGMSF